MKKLLAAVMAGLLLLISLPLLSLLISAKVESGKNQLVPHDPYPVSAAAKALHETLLIGDLHADSTLWNRDLLTYGDRGHLDIPRMQAGNLAIQVFTSVTSSPSGLNYQENASEFTDNITLLAIVQGWPPDTWTSLTARALHQAQRLTTLEAEAPQQFQLIRSRSELNRFLARRARGEPVVAGLLGIEGSHALDGDLGNIDRLYDAGFRMMSLQHFFDNQLGGSLHGASGSGLTLFGQQAIELMQRKGIMIDLSHSSARVVEDVLTRTDRPLLISHTGFHGHCPRKRNIPDELMIRIAATGGLIGVGFWDEAVCEATPESIAKALRYGIDLVGIDHIALGSDFDGAVTVPFDASELAALTESLLREGLSETEIRKVMGENLVAFLQENLP